MMQVEEQIAQPAPAERNGAAAWLNRVRLRARRLALWVRAASTGVHEGAADGMAIFHAEVERILKDPYEQTSGERQFYRSDPEAQQLSELIRIADKAFFDHPSIEALRGWFGISLFELDLLNLAVTVEIDPMLRRAYAYLNDNASATNPTQWLAARLCEHIQGELLGPQCPLVKWCLARPAEGAGNRWGVDAPWVADPYFVHWLLGKNAVDPALGGAVEFVDSREHNAELCLYPDELREMVDFIGAVSSERAEGSSPAIAVELVGPEGSGKRTLAIQFSAAVNAGLLCADAEALLSGDVPAAEISERIIRVMRMAHFNRVLVYWRNSDRIQSRAWQVLERHSGVTLFGSTTANPAAAASTVCTRTIHLPRLKREMRIALWESLCDRLPPQLITEGSLTPGEIARAAQMAPAGMLAVTESCQENLRLPSSELFTSLRCPFTWDDIVLANSVREHLRELEQQVRLRWQVYEEWGFERLCPMGRGITALFSGASGTGKTMAAQVLARSLDLMLYRVDLSGVVNKYIGETEKRLKSVFDACERANVLLFFDEADALFGQRTQVKDAHDRFANIEIDYLLQRMEQFDGVAVLATNRKGDLDKAFLRRIRFVVDFQPPGPIERHILWRRALTARSPAGEEILDEIDWDLLANKLVMTGAAITSAALGAAFLARAEGGRIAMSHVLHAARREMNKQAVSVRPGEWER
jgi:hypothetical protein